MAPDRENYRGVNAVRVLGQENNYTLEKLAIAANDPYLAAFKDLIPDLVNFYKSSAIKGPKNLTEAIKVLDKWDFKYGINSIGTSLAIYYAEDLGQKKRTAYLASDRKQMMSDFLIQSASTTEKLASFKSAIEKLTADFGTWKTPWGEIMRFQRLTGEVQETYDDELSSIPIGFTSGRWGSLAAVYEDRNANTKRRYGRGGNSFVALVEFGKKLTARSIVSGGQSSEPDSPHFTDQAELFCKGAFKEVYYYKADVLKNQERSYRPGEKK